MNNRLPRRVQGAMRFLLPLALVAVALTVASARKIAPTGTITGKVTFAGKPPATPAVKITDPFCKKQKVKTDTVRLDKAGGVADAFVVLRGVTGTYQPPATPLVIDQKACTYEPRMSGAVRGQKIQVRNSDATLHNVHGYLVRDGDRETAFNLAQPKNARPIERDPKAEPGEILTLKCDVHAWMRADIVVTDHPFFAVTAADGSFSIKDVPPGKYTIEAWHPVLGKSTGQLEVAPGKTATADLALTK